MIIRVRTNIGIWRVNITSPQSSITTQTILDTIAQTRPHVVYEAPLSLDPKCSEPIDTSRPLCEQHGVQMRDGLMIYCKVDSSTCAENTVGNNNNGNTNDTNMSTTAGASEPSSSSTITKRIIAKDGTIKLIHTTDTDPNNNKSELGFRKGLMPLRDIKKSWTLNEFNAMDDKYNFKIKRQESSFVGVEGLHLESGAVESFQNYLRRFQFRQQRFGYLYGRFVEEEEEDMKEEEEEDRSHLRQGWGARMPQKNESKVKKNKKVIVEAIYEPPQEADADAAEGFVMLDDDQEENVEQVASLLGLRKVGWIVGQPPRETGFQFSAAEVIMAAELQLECAQCVEETPFVTVRCTVGDEGNVIVEAFQVSLQCMEMVAEEALDIGPNPGFCYVNETFTAIQEGKPSPTVENNFFLTLVPIHGYQSDMFVTQFPFVNRPFDDRQQTHDEMKRQLTKSGQAGWTFIDLLSDFALLLYLCKFLDVSQDMPKICESVKDREVLLDDGYKIIISSMAGMDGSY